MIDDDPYMDDCPWLMDGSCPVMLEEQDELCEGCHWLTLNPDYVPSINEGWKYGLEICDRMSQM